MPHLLSKAVGLSIGFILAIASAASIASAEPVTYTYTGNDFTNFVGTPGLTTTDSITASVTFASALGSSLAYGAVVPTAWTFTDGVHTVSSTDANSQSSFEFGTDATGAIDEWYAAGGVTGVWGMYLANPQDTLETLPDFTPYKINEASEDWSTFESVAYDTTPGSWSEEGSAGTPEPSTLVLLAGACLFAVAVLKFRRVNDPRRLNRILGVVVLGLATSLCVFAESVSYSISVIPAPAGFTGVGMFGINDSGQVAGSDSNGTAFIGTPSGSTVIPLPAGWSSAYGFAINDSGQVAGYGFHGSIDQAFIGTAAGSTVIPLPAGWSSAQGIAINDSGQVAGYDNNQAFIGTTVSSTAIPLPAGWSDADGLAINDSGQVAGNAQNGSNLQAFIGTTAGSTAIPLPAGWSSSLGFAINNSGQVAGYGYNGSGALQAFIGTTAIPLPTGATEADAAYQSLNDSGYVVGYSDAGGWIWDPTDGTVLLNASVPVGWNIDEAISISNDGLILAQASYDGGPTEYVELSPDVSAAPEPCTILLACAGLLLTAAARTRRLRARA